MNFEEVLRSQTDPALHPELLAGYDEELEKAFRDNFPEPEDRGAVCFVCGEPADDSGLCPVHKEEADDILESPLDRFVRRMNEAYYKEHGLS